MALQHCLGRSTALSRHPILETMSSQSTQVRFNVATDNSTGIHIPSMLQSLARSILPSLLA